MIHYFLKHKGELWESSALSFRSWGKSWEAVLNYAAMDWLKSTVENVSFQNTCFKLFRKIFLNTCQGPLQWMSLLQKAMYNSKAEVWTLNLNIYRGQNCICTLHTHTHTQPETDIHSQNTLYTNLQKKLISHISELISVARSLSFSPFHYHQRDRKDQNIWFYLQACIMPDHKCVYAQYVRLCVDICVWY